MYVESRFLHMLRATFHLTSHVVYCSTLSLTYQFKGTHAYAYFPALVDFDPNMHIQAAFKERVKLVFLLFARILPKDLERLT